MSGIEFLQAIRHAFEEVHGFLVHVTLGVAGLPQTRRWKVWELYLQLQLSPLLMAVYGWASVEVEHACQRSRSLAGELGLYKRLYPPLWGLWSVFFLRGALPEAEPAAKEVQGAAAASGHPLLRVTAQHAAAYLRLSPLLPTMIIGAIICTGIAALLYRTRFEQYAALREAEAYAGPSLIGPHANRPPAHGDEARMHAPSTGWPASSTILPRSIGSCPHAADPRSKASARRATAAGATATRSARIRTSAP